MHLCNNCWICQSATIRIEDGVMLKYFFRKIAITFLLVTLMFSCYFLFVQGNHIIYFNVNNGESWVYDCNGYFFSTNTKIPPDDKGKLFYNAYGTRLPCFSLRFETSSNPFSPNAEGLKFVPFASAEELREYAAVSGRFLEYNDLINAGNWFDKYHELTECLLRDCPTAEYRQCAESIIPESSREMDSVMFSLFMRNFPTDLLACVLVSGCVTFIISLAMLILHALMKVLGKGNRSRVLQQ